MNTLDEFTETTEKKKSSIFAKFKEYTEKAKELIDKLEIGHLNRVYKLGKLIHEEFKAFLKTFP